MEDETVEDEIATRNYVVNGLLHRIISHFDVGSFLRYSASCKPLDHIIDLLDVCSHVGAEDQCRDLLELVLIAPGCNDMRSHISEVLVPFVGRPQQFLLTRHMDISTQP